MLADVVSPPAPLTVNWGTLAASDVEPAVLPRLGAGQAMVVLARVKRVQAANARARGELFAFEALAPARAIDGATTPRGPLARRWARERLGDLLAGKHDRAAVTRHALAYGLVSPYTSLVAIGSDVIVQGGVKHSVAVPVSLPAGMQWHAVKPTIDVDTSALPSPQEPESIVLEGRAPATPPPAAPVTPRPPAHRKTAGDAGGEDDDARSTRKADRPARDEEDRSHKKPAPRRAASDAPRAGGSPASKLNKNAAADDQAAPPLTDAELAKLAEQEAKTEVITVTGSLIGRKETDAPAPASVVDREALGESIALEGMLPGSRRALRLTAALGGGLAFDHGARGLLAFDARLETNRRTRVGAEAGLRLVGGGDPEGRALFTVARSGLARWFELGFGAGIQFGNGTGVAGSLRLRGNTPIAGLAGYLRYDAALLLTRPDLEAEHAVTLGLELSY